MQHRLRSSEWLIRAATAVIVVAWNFVVAAAAATGPAIIEIGTGVAEPGHLGTLDVRLHGNGLPVVIVDSRISTDPPLCLVDCTLDPYLGLNSASVSVTGCDSAWALLFAVPIVAIPDGTVLFSCDVAIAPGTPDGFYPVVHTLPYVGVAGDGPLRVALGVNGGIFVGTAAATCGNLTVELDEECDDGNMDGGDGCAANCTVERSVLVELSDPSATVQTGALALALALRGPQELLLGSPRASDPDAIIPAVAMLAGTALRPAPILGVGCACLHAEPNPDGGAGIAGRGEFGCGIAGLPDVDYEARRDHNTDDVDQTCAFGSVESAPHPAVCNGPLITTSSGQGVAGSGRMEFRYSLRVLSDGGTCATDLAGASPCPIAAYGPDCVPCSDDDVAAAASFPLALTTGTAQAAIEDVGNELGQTLEDGAPCGSGTCQARASGEVFSCPELVSADVLSIGAWAAAAPMVDHPSFGDSVLSIELGVISPTPSPTPTRTPSFTGTPTRTRTATPTATLPDADGSLILTRVRLLADTARRPGRENGALIATGLVNVNDPFAPLVSDVVAHGVTAMVSGAGGVAFSVDWTGAQCAERSTGRGPVVSCIDSDRRRVTFKPTRTPNVFRMVIKARRIAIPPPFTAAPIAIELRTVNSRRSDSIANCTVREPNQSRSTCRESGFVGTTPTATSTPTFTPAPPCPGDCNDNGVVAINESLRVINIGLGSVDLSQCPAADSDLSGTVDVADLVRTVRASLQGCGASLPPPTPGGAGTVAVHVGTTSAVAGGIASVEIRLTTSGYSVAAVQQELSVSSMGQVCLTGCETNPAIGKPASSFALLGCEGLRAWTVGIAEVDAIPDNSVILVCHLEVEPDAAPGSYSIDATSVVASDTQGFALPSIGVAGGIAIGTSAAELP